MEEFGPWMIYAAAIAATLLYLGILPDVFVRRRLGLKPDLASWLFWPCMIALFALFAWPFFAATGVDFRRQPSVWGILLMALGATMVGWVLQLAVQYVLGAWLHGLSDAGVAHNMRRLTPAITIMVLGLSAAAWWSISQGGQCVLAGRSYC